MGYDGTLKFDTKIDSSGFESGISKLSSLAGTAAKAVAAITAAGAAAFGAITKSSLDSVASLEQNIGGIETLFQDSASTVISNAKQAFATAGMSANEYMQTVTSFAAALIQGASNTAQQRKRRWTNSTTFERMHWTGSTTRRRKPMTDSMRHGPRR